MALWDRFISSGDTDKRKAKEHWNSALKYFEGKLFNRALKDMQSALAMDPDLGKEAMELMNSFSTTDNNDMALSVGFALLKLEPTNFELINKLGNSLRKTHSFPKAKKLYTHAIKINPKYVEAKYNLAACSFRILTADSELVSQTRKIETYTQFRRFEFMGTRYGFFPVPNQELNEDPRAKKGEDEVEMDEEDKTQILEGMIQELKSDVESSDDSSQALYNLALFYDLNGLGELAVQNYKDAMSKEPEEIATVNNLAVALVEHEDKLPQAESLLLKNMEKHPFDRTTALNVALLYRKMGKQFQTIKYFVYAGDLLNKSLGEFGTEKLEQYAKELFERRKYLEAVPVFENLAFEKQEEFWYEKLCVMYLNQKKEDKYIFTLKRMTRINPDNADAKSKLAEFAATHEKEAQENIEKGNRRRAIESYMKAVQIEETPERWVELAQLYQEDGEEILADNALRRWKKLTGEAESGREQRGREAG